jgi:hypothetical protein
MGTDYNSVCATIGRLSGKSEQIDFMCGILDLFVDQPHLLLSWKGDGHVVAMKWLIDNDCIQYLERKYQTLLSHMVGVGLVEWVEEV